jgi:O-antigen/teichoic acid export membrane protein
MRVLRRFYSSSFLKGVVAIAGGTALAQVAGVLFLPLLTRLYSPEAMGLWGLFVSLLGVASVASTLRYDVAIVAAQSEEEALAILKGSLVVALLTSSVSAFALEFIRKQSLSVNESLPWWFSLAFFLALLSTSAGMVLRNYAIRKGAFGLVGRFVLAQGLARNLSQAAFFSFGSAGLVLGETLGRFWGLLNLWRMVPRVPIKWWDKEVLLKYRHFPVFQLPSSILDTMALAAPVPVFVALYGVEVGGKLAIAIRLISLPVTLIGASVADVFYSRVATLVREAPRNIMRELLLFVFGLAPLGFSLGLIFWFLGRNEFIVTGLLGENWEGVGHFLSALAPWHAFMFIVSPVSRLIFLSRLAYLKIIYDALSVIVVFSPLVLAMSDPVDAMRFVSQLKVCQLVIYLSFVFYVAASLTSLEKAREVGERTWRKK